MKKDLLRELRDEVTNLHMLGVCEYIAHFKTAYEDRCFVHVLQEFCSGGVRPPARPPAVPRSAQQEPKRTRSICCL